MKQGRLSLVMLTIALASLLGCGLQSDSASGRQTSRLMDELRAQTALKARLQQDVDQARADLTKLHEEADALRSDMTLLLDDNENLASEIRDLKRERDGHVSSLRELHKGIKSLLEQTEACLPTNRGTVAAAKVRIEF